MYKMLRVVEIMWLVIAAVCAYEVVMRINQPFDDRFYIFAGGVVLGIFMYFFRRSSRIKMESRRKQQ